MLTILTNNSVMHQILAQYIPSSLLNINASLHSLFDESFSLETRELTGILKFHTSSVSTLLNDVLSTFVAVNSDLPNVLASMFIVFIFSKMYSKTSTQNAPSRVFQLLKIMVMLNAFCYFTFFGVRAVLSVLPTYYQTKH